VAGTDGRSGGSADEKVSINLKYCKGCGICWNVCPLKCIKPVDELEFPDGVVRVTYSI
jgi:Pyruvate/2-oxoacid:ferredoxin oxidoreductase delta subunit